METDIEARLAEIKRELARQNEQWERARHALERLGDEPLTVPREFFRQLDALAQRQGADGAGGIRA